MVLPFMPRRFPLESYVDKPMANPWTRMLRNIARLSVERSRSRCSRRTIGPLDGGRFFSGLEVSFSVAADRMNNTGQCKFCAR